MKPFHTHTHGLGSHSFQSLPECHFQCHQLFLLRSIHTSATTWPLMMHLSLLYWKISNLESLSIFMSIESGWTAILKFWFFVNPDHLQLTHSDAFEQSLVNILCACACAADQFLPCLLAVWLERSTCLANRMHVPHVVRRCVWLQNKCIITHIKVCISVAGILAITTASAASSSLHRTNTFSVRNGFCSFSTSCQRIDAISLLIVGVCVPNSDEKWWFREIDTE